MSENNTDNNLLEQTSRVALAAMLHDIGKFSQRAGIDFGKGNKLNNEHLYCPFNKDKGYHTHKHAAYTAMAIDFFEQNKLIPEIINKEDFYPFTSWGSENADDSLINAAAMHHKYKEDISFLQNIIKVADCLSSGFERNDETDESSHENYINKRMRVIFESVQLGSDKKQLKHCYKLKALSSNASFPEIQELCEVKNGQDDYKNLWQEFILGLKQIKHKGMLPYWLDCFDSALNVYTSAIPSATYGTVADVSLYDHSKSTAAFATALWRYHKETKTENKESLENKTENKFLLIQGDFWGIQDFILAQGGETDKDSTKLLRGRSFFVSLLMECCALKILEALSLPSTSQITNAAGKFLILAHNTNEAKENINKVIKDVNEWFLKYTYGKSGLSVVYQDAYQNDFSKENFAETIASLFHKLDDAKVRKYDLINNQKIIFEAYLDEISNSANGKPCNLDGFSPVESDGKGELSNAMVKIGDFLTKKSRIVISKLPLDNEIKIDLLGYRIKFTEDEEESGKFSKDINNGNILRIFDFSLPKESAALWNGYARRNINCYVSKFNNTDGYDVRKYNLPDKPSIEEWGIKSFGAICSEDRIYHKEKDEWSGISALGVIKGDVDNLGTIFSKGFGKRIKDGDDKEALTFAKMASLSRQLNDFFAVYLPYLCETEFRNTYTVFAGGDDFFLIGPWYSQIRLAKRLKEDFDKYVVNPEITFSAGLSLIKAGLPIRTIADRAKEALEKAKAYPNKDAATKNAITVFDETVSWSEFKELYKKYENLEFLSKQYELGTGYIYGLLELCNMAGSSKPEDSIWRSRFYYKTARMVADRPNFENKEEKKTIIDNLAEEIGEDGIARYKKAYKIALSIYLYNHRT